MELVARARSGDESAVSVLVERFRPLLERWAHGRVPASARGLVDTVDLVQDSMISVYKRLDHIEVQRPGAFWLYLRETLRNRLSNALRDSGRRPQGSPIDTAFPDQQLSDGTREALIDYEKALPLLKEDDRAAIVLRVEFGLSHQEVATALGLASPDAARVKAARALARLAEHMGGKAE